MTRKNQFGFSLTSIAMLAIVLALGVLVFLRVVPVVSEYMNIKGAISTVAATADPSSATVSGLRTAFSKHVQVNQITSISAEDLDITKMEDGKIVISVSYSRKVPLAGNVSLLIDFSATSAPSSR